VGAAALATALEAEARPEVLVPHPRRDYVLRRALAIADLVAVSLALLLAFWISPVESRDLGDAVWFLPLLPVWLVLFRAYGLYGLDAKRITHGALDEVPALFHSFLIGLLISWAWFRAVPAHQLALGELVTLGLAGLVLVVLMRSLVRRMSLRRFGRERVLFIGRSPVLRPLLRKIRTHPEYGLELVGFVDDEAGSDVLGSTSELTDLVDQHHIDWIVLAFSEAPHEQTLELVREVRRPDVHLSIVPNFYELFASNAAIEDIEGVPVVSLPSMQFSRTVRMLKRTFDIVASGAGLLLISPILAVSAIAIKLDSRGPVFFRQARHGRGGREFRIVKFRTMVADAEAQRLAMTHLNQMEGGGPLFKMADDPRITRVGAFLRKWSIDELPQLWNVLRGEMSLVGPRPFVIHESEQITGWASRRLETTPGITGLWQVLGRNDIPFEEMVKLDYVYVTNWSLWWDVKILVQTLPTVLKRQGAY